jgi:hypothetical protein
MKTLTLSTLLFLASLVAQADECQVHTAYATSGTVTASTASGSSAQNGVVGYAFFNPFVCTTTGVAVAIEKADTSTTNYYGFALVGVNGNATAGNVYATTGPVTGKNFTNAGANGVQSIPWLNGPITNLPVGVYMLVLGTTCSSSCAELYGDASLGQFYPLIYADTTTGSPWAFSSSSGFNATDFSSYIPSVSISLSTTAKQYIMSGSPSNIAVVTLNTTIIGHIYTGATISVQGVTGAGSGLNCVSCIVYSVSPSTGVVEYYVPSATWSGGTVIAGTLSVSPVLVQQAGFVAPTALIY